MCFSSVIQHEDIITEILLRLAAKALGRFKCVSKQWLAIISTHYFMDRYLSKHQRFPLLLTLTPKPSHPPRPSSNVIFSLTPSPLTHYLNFDFLSVPKHVSLEVTQSCNGLLLLIKSQTQNTIDHKPFSPFCFVCNPITKRFFPLENVPELVRYSTLFLVYEPLTSSHFEIVSISLRPVSGPRDSPPHAKTTYFLFWVSIYSSETGCWGDFWLSFDTTPVHDVKKGVYCNGALHWYSLHQKSSYFDVQNRRFKTYPMPPQIHLSGKHVEYFGHSRGHLHLIFHTQGRLVFDIFELQKDYSAWSNLFRVDLSTLNTVNLGFLSSFFEDLVERLPGMNLDLANMENMITHFDLFGFVRQEKEGNSLLLFVIDDKVFSYNLVDTTFTELSEFQSMVKSHARVERSSLSFKLFEYFEIFSSFGGFID